MGELGQELRLLVVLEVDVRSGQVDLQAGEGGHGANLRRKVACWVSFESAERGETYALALGLLGDRVECANRGHFEGEWVVDEKEKGL